MIRKASFLLLFFLLCSCSNDYTLCLVFDNVEGLTSNSQVVLNGVEIAEIGEMRAFAGGVYVTLSVDGIYKIPKGSKFRLMDRGLIGNKFIDVEYSSDKQFLKDNDTIKGIGPRYDYNKAPEGNTLTIDEIDTLARRWGRAIKEELKPNNKAGKSAK